MNKRIITILTAIALVASLSFVAVLASCNKDENEGNNNNEVELTGSETGDETNGTENGNNSTEKAGNPGEYTYTDCNETVYVYKSAVHLRTAGYEDKGQLIVGTKLTRTGISTDEDKHWSRVIYNEETLYVVSKNLTDINETNPDDGFVTVEKTVYLKKDQNLNIRDLPSMQSTVLGDVFKDIGKDVGIKVIAENTTTEWYKIEFKDNEGNTKTGYIVSDAKYYATADTNTDAGNTNTQEPTGGNGK